MINTVIIEGNLTRDAELTYTASGKALCKLGVANNRSYKREGEWKEEVSFFDVTAWGKLAEKCAPFLKGGGVVVAGRLQQDRWQGKDSSLRSKVCIIADAIRPIHKAERQMEEEAESDIPF